MSPVVNKLLTQRLQFDDSGQVKDDMKEALSSATAINSKVFQLTHLGRMIQCHAGVVPNADNL